MWRKAKARDATGAGKGGGPAATLSRGKKAAFILINLVFLLVILEGGARLLLEPRPDDQRSYPGLKAYYRAQRELALIPRGFRAVPAPLRRVPGSFPGARHYAGEGGDCVPLEPETLPTDRRVVLILGGSAAYGLAIDWPLTYTPQVEQALSRDPGGVELVNLARPAWELDSQVALLRQVVPRMRRPPAAVVIYAGNNEVFEQWQPPRIGRGTGESLGLYRLLRRWLRPARRLDAQGTSVSPEVLLQGSWLPQGGLKDASFWLKERDLYLDHFAGTLRGAVDWLRQRGVQVVLLPVPVNLTFFAGRLVPQPLTYRQVGREQQQALRERLGRALALPRAARIKALRALVEHDPRGVVQRYALGRALDQQRQHAEALEQLTRARDWSWGYTAALPSIARLTREMAGEGVHVVDTRGWYRSDRSVRDQVERLFLDVCHLNPAGHKKLAGLLTPTLRAALGAAP